MIGIFNILYYIVKKKKKINRIKNYTSDKIICEIFFYGLLVFNFYYNKI